MTAAAGGVGIAAVQLAKGVSSSVVLLRMNGNYYVCFIALGAKVIAAAGSETKLDIAKRHGGADYGVNYSNAGWQKEVLRLTNGKGVDVIYDPVGLIAGRSVFPSDCKSNFWPSDCLKCVAWKGRALVIGFAGGTIEKVRFFVWCINPT